MNNTTTRINEIDDRTLDALNARRDALRAYEEARSVFMGFVVSPFIYDGDAHMAEARLAAVKRVAGLRANRHERYSRYRRGRRRLDTPSLNI